MKEPVSSPLGRSFMAVPALKKPRSIRELAKKAHEEHSAEVADEGLDAAITSDSNAQGTGGTRQPDGQ